MCGIRQAARRCNCPRSSPPRCWPPCPIAKVGSARAFPPRGRGKAPIGPLLPMPLSKQADCLSSPATFAANLMMIKERQSLLPYIGGRQGGRYLKPANCFRWPWWRLLLCIIPPLEAAGAAYSPDLGRLLLVTAARFLCAFRLRNARIGPDFFAFDVRKRGRCDEARNKIRRHVLPQTAVKPPN